MPRHRRPARRAFGVLAAGALLLSGAPSQAAPSSVKNLTGAGVADRTNSLSRASASADGRWVAYSAQADASCVGTLTFVSPPSGPQCVHQVFLQDTKSGAVTMVSRTAAGQANADATGPTISSDGRLVLFRSPATNLVAANPKAGTPFPLFLYDRVTKKLTRVALPKWAKGVDKSNPSWARISGDGNVIVFKSAVDLAKGEFVFTAQPIYALDRRRGTMELVTVDSRGMRAGASRYDAAVSGNGRYVAYVTSDKISPSDTDTRPDIYVRDTVARTTIPATVTLTDTCPPHQADCAPFFYEPSIDASGRLVSFHGLSWRGAIEVPIVGTRDLRDGKTTIKTLDELGATAVPSLTRIDAHAMSGDGKVLYLLVASDLATGRYTTTLWRWLPQANQATRVIGTEGNRPQGNGYLNLSTNRTGSSAVLTTNGPLASSDTDDFEDVYQVTP